MSENHAILNNLTHSMRLFIYFNRSIWNVFPAVGIFGLSTMEKVFELAFKGGHNIKHRVQWWMHNSYVYFKSAHLVLCLCFFKAKFSRAVPWPNCTKDVYWSVPISHRNWVWADLRIILCDTETSMMLLFTACIHNIIFFWQLKFTKYTKQ